MSAGPGRVGGARGVAGGLGRGAGCGGPRNPGGRGPRPRRKQLLMPDSVTPPDLARRSALARWLFRRVPALDSLRTYSRASFGRDLTAGLTVATFAVPQGM